MRSNLTPLCPYCGRFSELTVGASIYPRRPELAERSFYLCQPCQAWVGTHEGTVTPLGTLADTTLRRHRGQAHQAFDPVWRTGLMSRKRAYAWLTTQLNVHPDDCHIALFDAETCQRVVTVCGELIANKQRENQDVQV